MRRNRRTPLVDFAITKKEGKEKRRVSQPTSFFSREGEEGGGRGGGVGSARPPKRKKEKAPHLLEGRRKKESAQTKKPRTGFFRQRKKQVTRPHFRRKREKKRKGWNELRPLHHACNTNGKKRKKKPESAQEGIPRNIPTKGEGEKLTDALLGEKGGGLLLGEMFFLS